jgi:HTH-type transcriptional regulator/antitoxin HigA
MRASASYLALAKRFPIKPIATQAELDAAISVIDSLLCRTKPLDAMESGYLDSLSREVECYEEDKYPMPPVSDAEMLRHLIEAKDVSMSAVAASTGIAVSTISSVLAGKRQLNRRHIAKLAPYFGVEPSVFLD